MARSPSTEMTAVPAAPRHRTDVARRCADATSLSPDVCSAMNAQPISPPASPPSRMATEGHGPGHRRRQRGEGLALLGRSRGRRHRGHAREAGRTRSYARPDAHAGGRPHLQRGLRHRDGAAAHPRGAARRGDPRRRRQQPGRHGRARRGRSAPTDPGVSLLRRPAKNGLGSAYLAGFAEGLERGFDILVEMDADLSHDPLALPALVSAATHGADVAIGSRYVAGGSTPDWTWRRAFLSRWGNRYAALALGLAVNDSTSGYRAYRADALAPGRPRPRAGLRLRLPGRDDLPPHQPGRPGGRDPRRLRRPPRRRVQDVAARSSSRPSSSSPAGACGTS